MKQRLTIELRDQEGISKEDLATLFGIWLEQHKGFKFPVGAKDKLVNIEIVSITELDLPID